MYFIYHLFAVTQPNLFSFLLLTTLLLQPLKLLDTIPGAQGSLTTAAILTASVCNYHLPLLWLRSIFFCWSPIKLLVNGAIQLQLNGHKKFKGQKCLCHRGFCGDESRSVLHSIALSPCGLLWLKVEQFCEYRCKSVNNLINTGATQVSLASLHLITSSPLIVEVLNEGCQVQKGYTEPNIANQNWESFHKGYPHYTLIISLEIDRDYPPSCPSSGSILQLCKVSSVPVHLLRRVVFIRHMV